MRQLLLILFLLCCGRLLAQQPFNNEWIDYSKTYYKFKVGTTGLYRIPQALLNSNNLGSIPAEQFQLWRNGKQVPLYTSIATGVLGANDYIEFWGERNDGQADKYLYRYPGYQLSDKLSLQTDTAAFFLTVDPVIANNLRYTNTVNDVAHNTLPVEPYFMSSVRYNFRDYINRGLANNVGENVYSSSYDRGEFLSTIEIQQSNSPYTVTTNNLFVATNGPAASLTAGFAANSLDTRNVQLTLNNSQLLNQQLVGFDAGIYSNASVPLSIINSNSASFAIKIVTSDAFDRIVCSFIDLQYPRQFNFGGASSFAFSMPASAQGNYLEISNFNAGTATPVLYDVTNMRRYAANTAAAGLLRFALQPTNSASNFVLVNEDAGNSTQVNTLVKRNFVNLLSATNQGDYLIISNKILMPTPGAGPVEDYRSYRSRPAGGGFNAKVYDIDELVDQFAFGIKKHPLSIKNFIRYAIKAFTRPPTTVLLIGKGTTYEDYWYNQSSPNADKLNLVPTWGWPASDVLLTSASMDPIPSVAIGRISVVNPQELSDYLDKVTTFESQAASQLQTIANKAWMKQFVHVSGANDLASSGDFINYLNGYKTIITDTLMGGTVADFNKLTTGTATPIANAYMAQLFANGISLLTYFGHSAATTLDYNLNDPQAYNNTGKYPFFLVNGCSAGNFFDYDTSRFQVLSSLAEKFVLAPQKGAIGFIADTHFGLTEQLDVYSTGFYKSLSSAGYNKPIFKNMADAITALQARSSNFSSSDSFLWRMHAEEILLHGDPALKVYASAKPDYVIEDPQVLISPSIITVADNQFSVKAYLYNIGEALNDSVNVLIKRQYPDGSIVNLFNQKIKPLKYLDSIVLNIPIIASRDKGNNSITITIDNDNKISELSESNNTVVKSFVIFDDDISPAYPYNFSIINKSSTKLIASTANPLATLHQYVMELDTTELFNSSFKVSKTLSSIGGELEFDPGITFTDSTVYYWRVATVPTSGGYRWNTSSFVYLSSGGAGYNQSHLYQHFKSGMNRIALDSFSRRWKYLPISSNFMIRLGIFPRDGQDAMFATLINGQIVGESACVGHSLIFMVFDPVTLQPLFNQAIPAITQSGPLGGFMGSAGFCQPGREHNFEFSFQDTTGRRMMRDFMDWVPDGYIVSARLNMDEPYNLNPFVDVWKNDASIYGAGNTLYSRLKGVGFADLDSFYYPRTFGFIYEKNTPSFATRWAFTQGLLDVGVALNTNISTPDTLGYITSPKFGPVAAWHQLKWRGSSLDAQPGDNIQVTVVGIDSAGNTTNLYNLDNTQQDFDLSSVSATKYPYIQLVMRNADSIHLTPYQLRYWRLLADATPEGAVAPNIKYSFTGDTLAIGQPLNVALSFKNISDVAFRDSVKVQMQVIDKNNVTQNIIVGPLKKIAPGDTATVIATIDTKSYTGSNTLYINLNPNNAQPEQYLFNNFLYKSFYVNGDGIKPLLDVTFDGVHILNGDIVSAKPLIHVKLKDENQYVALDDTSLLNVKLQYPDNSIHNYRFGSDTLRFTPANLGTGENVATVDFTPALSADGQYILMVQGKDKSNNPSGVQQYNVTFDVYNKPMISNVFNYPNPFTTSTAFVFTLTGSVIPQNIKIQVLTVTGKIVREITKDELGPIHIGNNVTQFKWDGTDMYGSKLANGVYLYRVVTNLNGSSLDKFPTGDQGNTDKYFKAGYGKMYLMR